MKKQSIEFWKHIILSGKKVEPQNKEQQTAYQIAEYLIEREEKKAA